VRIADETLRRLRPSAPDGMTQIGEAVAGLVHEPTQSRDHGLDLTVAAIEEVTVPGRVDFGGGELDPAETEPVETQLRDPDDDYAWWTLDQGAYVVRYNESLTLRSGQRAEISPLERTLLAGAHHATFGLNEGRDPLETLIVVSRLGCRLKENCRLSRLTVREVGD